MRINNEMKKLSLNKKTITDLRHTQMLLIKGGADSIDQPGALIPPTDKKAFTGAAYRQCVGFTLAT